MKKKSKPKKNTSSPEELPRKRTSKRKKQKNWKGIFMVGALVLVMISFILSSIPSNSTAMKPSTNTNTNSNTSTSNTNKPSVAFKKEGTLAFLKKDGTPIANIDIEVADTEHDRLQGLMHRRYMDANHGMLFLMEDLEMQSFYMRNTYISLDIIYLDENKEVVSIQKNTVPLSEASLFSEGEALYIVEVNAGYCDQHGIGKGDKIEFERN